MTKEEADKLALRVQSGEEGRARERLATWTLEAARVNVKVAVSSGLACPMDFDDLAQEAALRALGKIRLWNPSRGCWNTFVARVTGHYIIDVARRNSRKAAAMAEYAEWVAGTCECDKKE